MIKKKDLCEMLCVFYLNENRICRIYILCIFILLIVIVLLKWNLYFVVIKVCYYVCIKNLDVRVYCVYI